MRLIIVIHRISEYRLLGSIVDAALARGWSVECWHDTSQARVGAKAYQFPDVAAAPQFFNGRPQVLAYDGPSEFVAAIRERPPDAIVSTKPPPACCGGRSDHGSATWITVQHSIDTFITYSPSDLLTCDVAAIYSKWWIGWAGRHFQEEAQLEDRDSFEIALEARARTVGFPALDAAAQIDPIEVRQRWGVPRNQPVVVLLPFPQGFGKGSFWPSMICAQPSRFRRALNVVAHGRFEYWQEIWRDRTDAAVVRAVRAFCEHNDAYLIVKSRQKTPIPGYLRAVADKCLYDEQFYPSTILEALSIASVSINFYSLAVTEAVPLGVPNFCITFSADDYCDRNPLLRDRVKRFFTANEGSPFQFAGVSTAVTIAEAIEMLPGKTLDEFQMDPIARRQYLRKYLGPDDRRSAERVIELDK